MKLMDKAAIVAELERLYNDNSLEMKEIDLEKYYHEFLQKEWFGNSHVRTISEMMAFTAKHFFELGLKAKEENEKKYIGYVGGTSTTTTK